MLRKINHIGIAVKNIKEAAEKYVGLTNITDYETEYISDQNVDVAMFRLGMEG